jgi:hypothetical protein
MKFYGGIYPVASIKEIEMVKLQYFFRSSCVVGGMLSKLAVLAPYKESIQHI